MKNKLLFFLIGIFTFSCGAKEKSTKIDFQKQDGHWGLINYFDSIQNNKSVAKFRNNPISWYEMLIQIKKVSIFLHGSILDKEYNLKRDCDTLKAHDFWSKWNLTFHEDELILSEIGNDTVYYHYRKRNDLSFLTEKMDNVHQISTNITSYFNSTLITGKYLNLETNDKVEFFKNGNILGLVGFDTFEIDNFFGISHPFGNNDVIYFEEDKEEYWNRKVNDNELVLTKFNFDGDYNFNLSREKVILKRL